MILNQFLNDSEHYKYALVKHEVVDEDDEGYMIKVNPDSGRIFCSVQGSEDNLATAMERLHEKYLKQEKTKQKCRSAY